MKKYEKPYLTIYSKRPQEKVCSTVSMGRDDTGEDPFDELNNEQG